MPQAFAAQYGAACLDGSPPAIYSSVPATPTGTAIIFFEGGGWCWGVSDCAGRASGGGGSSNFSSPTWNVGGMLSDNPAVNPNFYNASLYVVHYCDGTSHSSDATSPVDVDEDVAATTGVSQVWFRGRRNLVAAIAYMRANMQLDAAKTVVITGGSAGATTSYLAGDLLPTLLAPSTRVLIAPDAGFFLDAIGYSSGKPDYRNDFIAADPVWNSSAAGSLNADCMAVYAPQNQSWRCFLPQYYVFFLQQPVFVLNSAYDMWQVLNDVNVGCVPANTSVAGVPPCSAAQLVAFQQQRTNQVAALQSVLAIPGNGVFLPSCFVHEISVDYCSSQPLPNCIGWNIYTVPLPGSQPSTSVSMDQAFTMWFNAMSTMSDEEWDTMMAARRKYREEVIMPALAAGKVLGEVPSDPVAAAAVAEEVVAAASAAGSWAIIDPVVYPGNPSCPFPTPHPRPAHA